MYKFAKRTTAEAVVLAGDSWDNHATAWWIGRGRSDANNGKSPLFHVTVSGIRSAGETPSDWTAEYEEAAARTYVDAYNAWYA